MFCQLQHNVELQRSVQHGLHGALSVRLQQRKRCLHLPNNQCGVLSHICKENHCFERKEMGLIPCKNAFGEGKQGEKARQGDCRALIDGGWPVLQFVVARCASWTWARGAQGGTKPSAAEVLQATLGPMVTI